MSDIDREIVLDPRHTCKAFTRYTTNAEIAERGRSAHIFNDEATMERVAQAIIERGEFTEIVRGYERYGLYFATAIGYRISPEGSSSTPLFYGEVKIDAENRYHIVPRTPPS